MVVVGVIVWIGNLILGTPQALFLGVVAGLLEVIPSLGPILATIPAVILALLFGSAHLPVENWAFALIVIAFYILVQVIENQLLVPYILGDAVDLPPLIVIIGVVIGGSAFGLLGVFLATPVISYRARSFYVPVRQDTRTTPRARNHRRKAIHHGCSSWVCSTVAASKMGARRRRICTRSDIR